jgi:hypothetical protein
MLMLINRSPSAEKDSSIFAALLPPVHESMRTQNLVWQVSQHGHPLSNILLSSGLDVHITVYMCMELERQFRMAIPSGRGESSCLSSTGP